jgi:SAM-dependent methyltransferase
VDSTSATAFAGTASDYLLYRPPYPDAFLADLRALAKTTGRGALLDLATGPGRVAIPMAPHFERVIAVDAEAEMIDVGRREADRLGIENIDWRLQRAEALELPSASIELVTIGEAFHRLDQPRVLERAMRWLQARGAFATLAGEQVWRGEEPWKRVLVDVVNRWTHGALGDPNAVHWGGPVEMLSAAGLIVHEGEHVFERVWTCDAIVGYLFSTSIASRRVLGEAASDFADELRGALLACEPNDQFATLQRFGFTLGVKDGAA